MQHISTPFNGNNYWNNKGYCVLDGAVQPKRNMPVIHMRPTNHPAAKKRPGFWRFPRRTPKLKVATLKMVSLSPTKLWRKFKNGYINMMLKVAGDSGKFTDFGRHRIPQSRSVPVKYKHYEDFEARIVFEIYRSLSTSKGLTEIV